MQSRYVTIVTENRDIGILKVYFFEMNGQSVFELNT